VTRTLVVSDLHLGTRAGVDVLARESVRETLLSGLEGVDRLILLGDTLELRQTTFREVIDRAAPALRAIGERLEGRTVVVVPGNHDHLLAEEWLRRHEHPLGLENRATPERASHAAQELAGLLAPANVEVAYPGLWVADGVYATHGHYLDLHMTVPTLERLAIAVSGRLTLADRRRWDDVHSPDEYEAVLAPLYAWLHTAAQRGRPSEAVVGGRTVGAWNALRGSGRGRALRMRALQAAFPLAVRALNAAGMGPLSSEISMSALRRSGLRAMAEVIERLRVDARHVIFGHTHRTGPLEGDSPPEWLTPNDTKLHNAGSWVFSQTFSRDSQSAYWPGGAIVVADGEAPRLVRLLSDRDPQELAPRPVRA
jgi:UDP-2,3-diacylglucosamine pyrophosphatase LpxH